MPIAGIDRPVFSNDLAEKQDNPRHSMRILLTLTALTMLAACDVPFVPLI